LNNWNDLCSATSINGNVIQFNNACNITNFGQYVASSPNFTQVSIDEANPQESILIYPNPSKGIFHLSLPASHSYEIEIVDQSGRTVYKQTQAENDATVDLAVVANGVYNIRFTNELGEVSFGKLVKH